MNNAETDLFEQCRARALGWIEATQQAEYDGSTHVRGTVASLVAELSRPGVSATVKFAAARRAQHMCWGDEQPAPEWWATPIGKLCAQAHHNETGSVSYGDAAKMLGVSKGAVSSTMARVIGLDDPGSTVVLLRPAYDHGGKRAGIDRGSVMAEIVRRADS
jgi:hypothetical protein